MSDSNKEKPSTLKPLGHLLNKTVSRRTLLAALGTAGAAAAAAGLFRFSMHGADGGPDSIQVTTIGQLRDNASNRHQSLYYVVDEGQEGPFMPDPEDDVSEDNTGTVLVTRSGFRMKRVYTGDLNVKWFGAKGDGSADDTEAIRAAIQACREQGGGTVHLPQGRYVCTDTIAVPSGVMLQGAGLDEWLPSAQNVTKRDASGTHLIFTGEGPKTHKLFGITDMANGGGVRANPDAPGPLYKLTSFYHEDATGNEPAAQKLFSVGVLMEDAVQSGVSNLRITHNFNGIAGFNSATDRRLGDDWDIGLWVKNSAQGRYERIQVVGYWRMYGILVTSMNDPELNALTPSAESNRFDQCVMSGKVGMGFRSGDCYRCLAVTGSSVSVAWSPSNPFLKDGGTIRVGSNSYTYTGTTRVDERTLRFDNVQPNPQSGGVNISSKVRTSAPSNFGFAGTVIADCYISGFDHSSSVLCTNRSLSTPFDTPSACVEISGEPVRGLHFVNCTIQTREEVLLHLHDALDIDFIGCYFESKGARAGIGGAFSIPVGARFIASPFIGRSTAPYPAGESRGLTFARCTDNDAVCRQPVFRTTRATKFSESSGLFTPRTFMDDSRMHRMVNSDYPIHLPKGMPLALYDYNGRKIGSIGYNEDGELDLRSGSGDVHIRNDGATRMRLGSGGISLHASTSPGADNVHSLGAGASRWKDIYAANGTIHTSDANEKENVRELPAGMNLIGKLRPVAYKFKDYEEKMLDEAGNENVTRHQFARTHYGLIAQEVKSALDQLGLDAAAYVYDAEADRHALRYTEFIPVIIKALQELKTELDRKADKREDGP